MSCSSLFLASLSLSISLTLALSLARSLSLSLSLSQLLLSRLTLRGRDVARREAALSPRTGREVLLLARVPHIKVHLRHPAPPRCKFFILIENMTEYSTILMLLLILNIHPAPPRFTSFVVRHTLHMSPCMTVLDESDVYCCIYMGSYFCGRLQNLLCIVWAASCPTHSL